MGPPGHAVLVAELQSHVEKLVHDQNGNHVIQRCIQTVRPLDTIRFILEPFKNSVPALSRHPFGCRVVQRILENFMPFPSRDPNTGAATPGDSDGQWVLEEVMQSIEKLIEDQYGNYVVQHVLENGLLSHKTVVANVVRANLVRLCRHKFGSNIVELVMKHMPSPFVEGLIELMLAVEGDEGQPQGVVGGVAAANGRATVPLERMTTDSYANYVVQRVIRMATPQQLVRIRHYIALQEDSLRHYSYGKHILNCLDGQSHRIPAGGHVPAVEVPSMMTPASVGVVPA
jgi:pumilio RNA-binding family